MSEPSPRTLTESRAAFVDQRLVTALMRAFGTHAGEDHVIDAADLQRALGLKSEYLARRLLSRFDRDGDGVVRRDDFLDGVQRLVLGSDRDKLKFAFKLHDHDDDGSIDETELLRMISLSLAESEVRARPGQSAEVLARRLMAEADTNGDGRLSLDEFVAVVGKHPRILEKMTRSEALWIVPSEDLLGRLEPKRTPTLGERAERWLENRWRALLVVGGWGLANALLFASVFFGELGDPRIRLGNATGHLLSMNAAFVLLPVLRRLVTRLRAMGIGRVVPIDEALDFHAMVGHAMFGLAIVHAFALLAGFTMGHEDGSLAHLLLATRRGLTGLVLLVAFFAMWVFALERIRRSHRFEAFYFTHRLYVVWLLGAAVHEPAFLLWALVPMVALAIEQIVRVRKRGFATVAYQTRALRSGVTALDVERPAGFRFSPGDYAFLCIPAVSRHEWHPFTISSPPESETMTFHVRSLGNWSGALRALAEAREREGKPSALVVHVDGPYGSPTQHLFASRFAVLIGAGIGVTPFASVLGSIVRRAGTSDAAKLVKGYFYWVNRDQYSFEWFTELLEDAEQRDVERLFDVSLFMTQGRSGATSAALEAAREVSHRAGHTDVVTGLRAYTHMGPPDWKSELSKIRAAHAPEKVDVFFCGPPGLGAKIHKVCRELDMPYHEEKF
ncbi:MAG: EF-hand domain-containing protein [Sandaracinus sp.]